MSTAVATFNAQLDKYEKDFNTVVMYLLKYYENCRPVMSVDDVFVAQEWLAKK